MDSEFENLLSQLKNEFQEAPHFDEQDLYSRLGLSDSEEDKDFVNSLAKELYTELVSHINSCAETFQNKDWDNLRIAAHTIKGSCANLSLKKLSKAAEVLEKSSRARNEGKLDDEHYTPIFFEFFDLMLTEIDESYKAISTFVTDYDKGPLDNAIRDARKVLPGGDKPVENVNPPEPEKSKEEPKPEPKPSTAKVAPNDEVPNNTASQQQQPPPQQQQQQPKKEGGGGGGGCCIIV